MTMVQAHVRCLTLAAVLAACRHRACRWAAFVPASGIDGESLPWGRAVPPFTMRGGRLSRRRIISCHSSCYAVPTRLMPVLGLTDRTVALGLSLIHIGAGHGMHNPSRGHVNETYALQ
jgi:hypothetical protein